MAKSVNKREVYLMARKLDGKKVAILVADGFERDLCMTYDCHRFGLPEKSRCGVNRLVRDSINCAPVAAD
jgi:hypothetical protein